MADTAPPPPEAPDEPPADTVVVRRANWPRRILIGIGALLALLIVAILGGYAWLNTDGGRAFVTRQIEGLAFENGMEIGVGRIEGSIFGAMRLRNVEVRDPKGVFLSAPLIEMDWRPLAYLRNHVDIRSLVVPAARFHRQPEFRETPPSEGPLLPDLDVDVNRLEIGRLQIDEPVTGQRHLLGLTGTVDIADRRARIKADGRAIAAPGIAGGDRLALLLDAVPEDNRLTLDLRLNAPAQGLLASFTGVEQPTTLALSGKGDWQAWDGRLTGQMGSESLANVAITARDGTFTLRGPLRPGLFMTGPARNMLEPITQVDLTAALADRRARIKGDVTSDNFTFGAQGLVDLGASRMENLDLTFRLLNPSVIAENLRGADVAMNATLNGDFVAPNIRYGINARQIGFGATLIEGLAVSGSAALDKEQWLIPLQGSARRISGVNNGVNRLLTNVRLDGDLAYANGRILSDNMRLRSDRIDTTAVIVADLNEGLYTGALNGRVNGYQVESVGVFNLQTNMDLKSSQNGHFRLGGRVTARSTRLLNDGLQSFLGGNALIVADVGYDSNGVASLDRLNISAPQFRMTGASGRYAADGAVRFSGRGSSDQYGPLGVEITGTVSQPLVRVAAERPGMGIGLANVVATIRGDDGTYVVNGEAISDYGPVDVDLAVMTGRGPLTIDVRQGTSFAGVGLTGRLAQNQAGPFEGALLADGSGINGRVDLSSQAGVQRALVNATARNASLPGEAGVTIEQAIIKADALLTEQPQITADAQLAGARMGDLTLAVARGTLDYRNGAGQAKLLVEGRTRYPFRLAANAMMEADLWRVALDGRFNGVDVKTDNALRITPAGNRYTLAPARLSVGSGKLYLAGHYGDGMEVQARMEDLNLALANPFVPGLGLGGTATGSLDFTQVNEAAFPAADARLQIDGFTRTSLAAVSEPVDINFNGRLVPQGGEASALIRRRGAAIGRMQVRLQPLGPGAGSWTTRLLAAPLSGGLRYNGPADVLFSLAALPDQSLKGPLGVAADFTGRVSAPQLTGVARANNLTYENSTYGTRLTNMALRGRFTNDRLEVESLTAQAGDGTVSASGFVSLNSDQGFPIQLGIDMNNAQLARGQDLQARATGQIQVVNNANQPPTITGNIALPETRYRIAFQGSAEVPTLTGVRRKPALKRERISGAPEPMESLPADWRLDLRVQADNQIYVSGMGLESEWGADLRVGGTSGAPRITGGVNLVRGTLGFAGRSFELQQGRITFTGPEMTNPELRIVASGEVEDVTINITITGNAQDPQIAFTSTPSLPQDELMARILFGNSVGELSAMQAIQLAASLNSLRGGSGGLNPLGVLQSAGGIDRLRLLGADEETGQGTSLAVGQYITNDVYVEIITDARGHTATQLEIALSKALSVLSTVSNFGGTGVNLRYRKDY
ncbi:MAG: translocation/assembly module TamB domain-containing protein [Alphaproteobacteria bacterium]|nr:translocation/assembly module TamB domain-containing protein [Alphaproteobacteria bacterium]MBU0795540.1 translocation/assembly module TamB domain-containing protein [Alphaproteobacteria bacterium]MBU0874657.1 translocation/assembly module TamB domain-containing protein [Alphaproteobacteria bacterium]MBU1770065.1 translocation/assembly module TamB domain-containing protein [Alphaproteobacteria bacterium]